MTLHSHSSFDDAILSLHESGNVKSLFRATTAAFPALQVPGEVCLLLSRGTGLPPLAFRLIDGEVVENLLDPRWLEAPWAAFLRGKTRTGTLESLPIEAEGARFLKTIFPGKKTDSAFGLSLPAGKQEVNVLIFQGNPEFAERSAKPAFQRFLRHFETALGRILASEEDAISGLALKSFVGNSCTGLVVLDWEFRPAYSNRAAVQLCGTWGLRTDLDDASPAKGPASLPHEILQQCVRLKQSLFAQSRVEARPALSAVVECPIRPGLRAIVKLVRTAVAGIHKPYFTIRLECPVGARKGVVSSSAPPLHDVGNFLSASERQLVEVAAEGLPNEQIAARLGKSVATVKSQLQSIYRKLSISNRSELIARLFGSSQPAARQ